MGGGYDTPLGMLTDKDVRNAAARENSYKITGSGSLYLYVATTGLKSWRMKFRLHGKEKLLTFGPYPDVKLTEARDKRDEARRKIRTPPATMSLMRTFTTSHPRSLLSIAKSKSARSRSDGADQARSELPTLAAL